MDAVEDEAGGAVCMDAVGEAVGTDAKDEAGGTDGEDAGRRDDPPAMSEVCLFV